VLTELLMCDHYKRKEKAPKQLLTGTQKDQIVELEIPEAHFHVIVKSHENEPIRYSGHTLKVP